MTKPNYVYELVIEEITTHVVEVSANNKGMAKIKAKALIKHTRPQGLSTVVIRSCDPKEVQPEALA